MIEFIRRNRVLLSSSFFLVCSLALLSVNARHPGRIDPLGRAFLEVMAPFQRATSQGVGHAADLWRGYVDLVAGVPKTVEITDEEIRDSLLEPINQIVEAVRIALERTPPELASDIVDKGIVLAGGGALLRNLDVLLREETGLPIMLADDPLTAVVMGAGRALDEISLLKNISIS